MTETIIPVEDEDFDYDPDRMSPHQDPSGIIPTDNELLAEQSVLGAMMLSPEAVESVRSIVSPEDFYRPMHQVIARLILELRDSQKPTDTITVSSEVEARDLAKNIGGLPYLHTLIHHVPTAANAAHYAEIVRAASNRRALIRASERLREIGLACRAGSSVAEDVPGAVSDTMERYEQEINPVTREPAPFGADLDDWWEDKLNGELPKSLSTGLADLDRITDVRDGELLVIAARPSIGKSIMAMKLAQNAAISHHVPTLFFALEMTKGELTDRVMAAQCGVDHGNLRNKTLTEGEQQKIRATMDDLRDAPLWIEDGSAVTAERICAMAREYKRQHGLGLLVIDQLSLLEETPGRKSDTRERVVAEQSRKFRLLAKELDIPVVMVVQINRSPAGRTDKTPQLSDLRESGAIEADATQVWLLHRPDFGVPYDQLNPDEHHPGEVQILVAKNRGGKTGDAWFAFLGHRQDISDMPRS